MTQPEWLLSPNPLFKGIIDQIQGERKIDSTSPWENGLCIRGGKNLMAAHLEKSYHEFQQHM